MQHQDVSPLSPLSDSFIRTEDEDKGEAKPVVAREKGKIATDGYAIEEAKREAAGLLPASKGKKEHEHEPRHEAATDEQVYDRFKKRSVRSLGSRWS